MVKILAALSILNSSGASPGATEKVAALVTALDFNKLAKLIDVIIFRILFYNEPCNKI